MGFIHRDLSSSIQTTARNCEFTDHFKLFQLLILRLVTSVALPIRVCKLDDLYTPMTLN